MVTEMAQQEDIEEQKKLLETHRRTLSINLMQFALFGIKFVPPHVLHGIREARQQITSIKQILREWGVDVADYPDDEDGDNTIKDMLEGVANQSYVEPDSHRLFLRSEHSEIRSGAYNYITN